MADVKTQLQQYKDDSDTITVAAVVAVIGLVVFCFSTVALFLWLRKERLRTKMYQSKCGEPKDEREEYPCVNVEMGNRPLPNTPAPTGQTTRAKTITVDAPRTDGGRRRNNSNNNSNNNIYNNDNDDDDHYYEIPIMSPVSAPTQKGNDNYSWSVSV
ncbi:uncharacterized protein LOC101858805 [Aplysia californica]|uniref:Uncharacterized protein LOC101858805 n=1 Tax=Aplysia californica TaxID=6500 RepID=A0ABM1VZL0_APLCA|nr:uncharacterized protein LOC101858805 [Aplysia californica]